MLITKVETKRHALNYQETFYASNFLFPHKPNCIAHNYNRLRQLHSYRIQLIAMHFGLRSHNIPNLKAYTQ